MNYFRHLFILKLFGLGVSILGIATLISCKTTDERPNIVIIMADDMGFSDIGCYGGEIQTPNLDKLAENGIRFKQFYNTARCCPTRASLLTGLYAHQTGIGHMTNNPVNPKSHDLGLQSYRGYLNRNCVTIAEVLKPVGYHTLMSGKWHVGYHMKDRWPLQRGFDKYYGIISGGTNYFRPEALKGRGLTFMNDSIKSGENFYLTDAFTDYAVRFVKEVTEQDDQPFFLYLAYTAPHWPLHAPKDVIDKYRGKYLKGWEKLRKERFKRMQEMDLINLDWKLSPGDARAWNGLDEEKKIEVDLRMAIYAAQVDRMDQNIGRLINTLKEIGKYKNTLIFFLSDNGGCEEGGELGGGKPSDLESDRGWVLSYGRVWANMSNTPFRRYKHWVHEGGIATPLIAHWPKGIPDRLKGTFTNHYGHVIDFIATCTDLAGAEYPVEYNGNNILPLKGKSLLPLLKGKNKPVHVEPLFWEHEGNKAVRMNVWKLVAKYRNDWELFNMDEDRTEMNNLADKFPEKVKELEKLYGEFIKENHVIPWDDYRELRNKK